MSLPHFPSQEEALVDQGGSWSNLLDQAEKSVVTSHFHRKGQEGWAAGRYPVKAAEQILKVLENAEANAEYKGMDTEKLFIEHISSHKGIVIPGYIPRAFGRMTPFNTPTTHIQIVLQEAK